MPENLTNFALVNIQAQMTIQEAIQVRHSVRQYIDKPITEDVYFRDSFNPITPKLAIIQGELKPFFDLTQEMQSSTGEFYNRFITSLEENSMVIPYTLQS